MKVKHLAAAQGLRKIKKHAFTQWERCRDQIVRRHLPQECWFLVIADLHEPHTRRKLIAWILERELGHKGVGRPYLCLAGDTADLTIDSRFTKFDAESRKETIAAIQRDLGLISRPFTRTFALTSNHDARIAVRVAQAFEDVELISLLVEEGGVLDWPYRGLPNVERVPGTFMMAHDACYSHFAKRGSTVHGRTAENAMSHLHGMFHGGLLDRMPKLVVQGHIHRTATTQLNGALCMEIGPMCKRQDYSVWEPSAHSTSGWQPGYARVQFRKGKAVWHESRCVAFDPREVGALVGEDE